MDNIFGMNADFSIWRLEPPAELLRLLSGLRDPFVI
jgi:hypothetical protein